MDEPMTQFRAIPIEWGLSEDKYYKFLMWVSFKATFKGWQRCDALQVTFTIREAADKFSVSVSTISSWVGRAKSSGLLLPTKQSSREHGVGEVYSLGGDLLMTVKSPEQEPNNNRTSAEQPSIDGISGCRSFTNNNRTSAEQEPNANKEYSPVSPDTLKASSPSRARSSVKKQDEIPPIPEDALPFLEDLSARWYKKSHDGRRVTRLTPAETWKRIHKNREQDSVGVCINAGLYYLELDDNRYAIGMDNFFGKERKYTRYVVE